MENALSGVLQLIANLDPRVTLLLFGICAIGELGIISIPYLLESAWLLVGYQFGAGALSPLYLLGLWLAAQGGRQAGALILYYLARLGTNPLMRLWQRFRNSRFISKTAAPSKVLNRINLASPFSVAFGRLIGLRLPITVTLAIKKTPRTLALGIMLSSVIWDAIYVLLGMTAGATAVLQPVHLFFISLGGLTVLYLVTFLIRRLRKRATATVNDNSNHSGRLI